MRYFSFLCLALFCAGECSQAQNQSEPSPIAPTVAVPNYGIYTHARIQGPYLAMTFDDGPSAEYTPRLLDLLKVRHLKATFFLIGQNVQAHPKFRAHRWKRATVTAGPSLFLIFEPSKSSLIQFLQDQVVPDKIRWKPRTTLFSVPSVSQGT
jgi:hypothetical protein